MKNITPARIIDTAEKILAALLAMDDRIKPERKGCYIYVENFKRKPIILAEIGQCTFKPDKCFEFAQEKVRRIRSKRGHISSWQSRDFDNEKYGGAILTPRNSQAISTNKERLAIGVSGLTEKEDEAMSICIGLELGTLIWSDVLAITSYSNNSDLVAIILDNYASAESRE